SGPVGGDRPHRPRFGATAPPRNPPVVRCGPAGPRPVRRGGAGRRLCTRPVPQPPTTGRLRSHPPVSQGPGPPRPRGWSRRRARRNPLMEARPNDSAGPTAGTTVHHVTAAGRAVRDSPLPARAQEPVAPRVSRINGRAARVDRPTEEAAAAGQTPVRPNPVAAWREATVF